MGRQRPQLNKRPLAPDGARSSVTLLAEAHYTNHRRSARVWLHLRYGDPVTTLLQDLRYGLRMLVRSPGFALVAVATLALGIGANTAIFSVVNALLLRPLPYPDARSAGDRLAGPARARRPRRRSGRPSQQLRLEGETDVFAGLTSDPRLEPSVAGGDMPESLLGEQATFDYFDVLGTRPALGRRSGRATTSRTRRASSCSATALWMRRFGGDRGVIGRSIPINGESHEIIGVMPAGFRRSSSTRRLWRPLRLNPTTRRATRSSSTVVGRLQRRRARSSRRRRGGTCSRNSSQQAHPDSDTGKGINPVPLQEQRVGSMKPSLFMLQGAVALRAADRLRQHRQPAALARVRRARARSRSAARSAPIGCASSGSC